MNYWHFYGRRITRGYLRGVLLTVLVGPTDRPHPPRALAKPFRSKPLKHLATFDHQPELDEQERVRDRRLSEVFLEPVPVKRRG